MNKEDYEEATRILQKHVPNRYPNSNPWLRAMMDFAEIYHQQQVKNIALPSVICSKPTRREKNNLPEDVRYAFCEGVEIYQSIQHYEEGITDHSEFIEDVRAIKQKYK